MRWFRQAPDPLVARFASAGGFDLPTGANLAITAPCESFMGFELARLLSKDGCTALQLDPRSGRAEYPIDEGPRRVRRCRSTSRWGAIHVTASLSQDVDDPWFHARGLADVVVYVMPSASFIEKYARTFRHMSAGLTRLADIPPTAEGTWRSMSYQLDTMHGLPAEATAGPASITPAPSPHPAVSTSSA